MSKVYIAIESMSALVVLILIYANIFELKQKTRKRQVFTNLLISNEIIILLDLITWFNLNWVNKPNTLFSLIVLTYLIPFYVIGVFSKYIYLHISEKSSINIQPFKITIYIAAFFGFVTFLLCISGKIFDIIDGKYTPGKLESVYYLVYILFLIFFFFVIFVHHKELGLHDFLAAISFCVVPLISILLSILNSTINLAVPFLAIDTLVIFIMLQSERENNLFYQSNIDGLTSLFNRRAYQEDLTNYTDKQIESNFIYASIDINGLKQVNDTLGHAAGDELICGAAECLSNTFSKLGRVYRTGGDEFVMMLYTSTEKFTSLLETLNNMTSEWFGNLIDNLNLSLGYVTKKEFPDKSISELIKISDKRMYENKRKFYSDKGIDRRGQAKAHLALCNLYTKILKINITDDQYTIINLDESEKTISKGFSNTISGWFSGFAKSGQVHEEDLENYYEKTDLTYLKNYFKSGMTSLSIFYRRKIEDSFKNVAMDIIPADDYTNEKQTLFLYVKIIG